MPTLGYYSDYKAALETDCKAAFPNIKAVHFGWPQKPHQDTPYVVCLCPSVDQSFEDKAGSLNQLHQNWEWVVIYVDKVPGPDTNLIDFKVEKANAFTLQVERNTTYAGVGMNPHVSRVDLEERWEFPQSETVCTTTITFKSFTRRLWGT